MSAYSKLPSNDPERDSLQKAERLARAGLRTTSRALGDRPAPTSQR